MKWQVSVGCVFILTEQHVSLHPQEPVQKRRMSSMSAAWWSPTVCTGWWRTGWCLRNRPGPPSPASPCWAPLRSEICYGFSSWSLLFWVSFNGWSCVSVYMCAGPGVWFRQRGVPVARTGCFPQQEDRCSPADSPGVGRSLWLQQLSSQSSGSHTVQPRRAAVSSPCGLQSFQSLLHNENNSISMWWGCVNKNSGVNAAALAERCGATQSSLARR